MKIFVPEAEVPDAKQVALVHQQVAETIQRLPGVGGSGLVSTIPMANEGAYPGLCKRSGFEWIGDQKKCRSSLI